jgi:Bax protein
MKHICATLLLLCNPTLDTDVENKFINHVKECSLQHNSMIDEIDRIPIILVLAQAIHESDWGKSRFAREGNNLFGIRALEGEDFIRARSGKKVKKYFTWCESVNDYMELLLTSYHYKEFQKELENQWFNDEIDVNKLVDTLDLYAEDVYYKDKIKDVIKSVERRLE